MEERRYKMNGDDPPTREDPPPKEPPGPDDVGAPIPKSEDDQDDDEK